MEEKEITQENSSKEINQAQTKTVAKTSKFTPKVLVIAGVALLVTILLIVFIAIGGKGKGNNGGVNNNFEGSNENGIGTNSGTGDENETGGDSSGNGTPGGEASGGTQSEPVSFWKFIEGYSEGLAFVRHGYWTSKHSCIDKNGNIVFSIDFSNIDSGFRNGWVMITQYNEQKKQSERLLCDKNGNTKTAEELGGNAFIFEGGPFDDGYIFVHKTTTNYQGSIDELAIFNSKLEKIVDFSEELYNELYGEWTPKYTYYYNGYLFAMNKEYDYSNEDAPAYYEYNYVDLRTGDYGVAGDDFLDNIPLENKSDLWVWGENYNSRYVYDFRDANETPIIALDDNASIITTNGLKHQNRGLYGFSDGYVGLKFRVADAQVKYRYYFTIMDEEGNYCFEPVEISGNVREAVFEDGVFVLYTVSESPSMPGIEVFDKTGRIGCMDFEGDGYFLHGFFYSDGVICATYESSDSCFIVVCNTKLEPLFDVKYECTSP